MRSSASTPRSGKPPAERLFRRLGGVQGPVELPWLEEGLCGGYEDWHLLDGWSSIGVLEEAAVATRPRHRARPWSRARPPSRRARSIAWPRATPAFGGDARVGVWVTRAAGREHPSVEALLGDGMDRSSAGLRRRCSASARRRSTARSRPEQPGRRRRQGAAAGGLERRGDGPPGALEWLGFMAQPRGSPAASSSARTATFASGSASTRASGAMGPSSRSSRRLAATTRIFSLACPWCYTARRSSTPARLGLQDLDGRFESSYLAPFRDERGWAFTGERFTDGPGGELQRCSARLASYMSEGYHRERPKKKLRRSRHGARCCGTPRAGGSSTTSPATSSACWPRRARSAASARAPELAICTPATQLRKARSTRSTCASTKRSTTASTAPASRAARLGHRARAFTKLFESFPAGS